MNMSVLHKKVNIKITIAILSLEVVAALLSLFLIVYPSINVKQVKAAGITYWVDVANGNDDNCTGLSQTPYVSGTNQACPFKTIQKAIGTDYISGATRIPPVVACGDIVNVKPGDYRTPAGTIKVNNVAIAINDSAHKPTLVNRNCVATSNFITIQAVNSQGARNPAVSDGGIAINGGLTANTSGITLTDGFVFSASSNIILDGFEITIPQDVAWNNGARGMGVGIFNGSNNITVKNNYIHHTLLGGIVLNQQASNDTIINNILFYAGTGSGITANGSYNTIENNDISHTIQHPLCTRAMIAAKTSVVSTTSGPDADGMKVEGTFQTIRGNWIHDNRADDDGNSCKVWNATSGQYENYSLPHFDGIQLSGSGASNLTIEKNIIDLSNIYLNYKDDDRVTPVCQTESNTDIPRRHQGCWATYLGVNPKPFLPATSYDGTLKKDVCIVGGTTYTTTADIEDHCCVEGCYTGGVYISGGGTNIVNVRNNIIRSCQPIGLYNINGGSVVNNTLIQGSPINSGHGIQIYSSSQGIQVSNNIVYGASPSLWENYLSVNSSTSITASNNLYFNIKDKIGSGYTTASGGDINDNPDFTNYASKAYSLLLGSPAINAGWPISGLTEDILGATRPQGTAFDIGAYEYPQSVENPVDGSCGTANGAGVTSAPTSSLCSTGTTSAVSGSGPWTWTCTGSGGGATASCSAPLKVDGVCNSNTIGSYTSSETFPRSSYCSAGTTNPATPTNPAAGGSTSWTCVGLSGGATSVMCTAIRALAPINGACGTAAKTFTYSDPFPDTYTICATGTASAVSPVGGPVEGGSATWTCTGLNNGTTSGTCTATRTASPGACGEAARAYTYSEAFATSGWCVTGTANPAAPTNPAQGGSSTWNCVGSTTVSCTAERAAAPIIGSCGTAISTNHIFAYNETFPGSYTYCAKGTANPAAPILAVGGTTTWMCNGLNGGGNSGNCTAQKAATPINGQCNTSTNGVAVSAKPTTNLCTTGTASTVSGSGPWTWTCTGSGTGHTDASCSAPLAGKCGSANGVATLNAPSTTSSKCSKGTASSVVSNTTTFTWTCTGSTGGTNASCSAPRICSSLTCCTTKYGSSYYYKSTCTVSRVTKRCCPTNSCTSSCQQ